MNKQHDPLWQPQPGVDPTVDRLELLLSTYGAKARGVDRPPVPARAARRWSRPWLKAAAASLVLIALLFVGFQYRLHWPQDRGWHVERLLTQRSAHIGFDRLQTGGVLETRSGERINVDVARIGTLELSPESVLRLLETSAERHRVSLESGHLRARLWAPPGYFGVEVGGASIIDIGCEFEVWRDRDGAGRVAVNSGWVAFMHRGDSVLVPAGYTLDFDASVRALPLRGGVDPQFAASARHLADQLDQSPAPSRDMASLVQQVVASSQPADSYTLLSLLTQQHALAATPLFDRLAMYLGIEADIEQQRRRWEAGDLDTINDWWNRYPSQPKRWWQHWRDALPRSSARLEPEAAPRASAAGQQRHALQFDVDGRW